jgi:uncharacterized membrane protein YhaH (DUF805 family)
MKIKKTALIKILLWTFFLCTIITLIAIFIIQANTRKEGFSRHSCDMSGIAYGLSIGFNLFLTIASLTLFLNLYKTIRNNFWYSFASFFMLPLIVAGYFSTFLQEETYLFVLSFFIVLFLFFLRFRKNMN